MKIAQVAPLYEAVPPKAYGGTERVVSYLTEELVALGHEVTLFASGDSATSAKLVACCDTALRLNRRCVDSLAPHLAMLEQVAAMSGEFDVIHFHCDYLHFPISRRSKYHHLTTLHGRLDIPELPALYRRFPKTPVVSISDAQRAPLPTIDWLGTVHHGLPTDLYRPSRQAGEYFAFLGRICAEKKRVDRAIEIARAVGMPLKIAAKIDRADRDYFRKKIEPLMAGSDVEFVGEINGERKNEFLSKAKALLFPIDWPEPFGLVMIEAMACGLPVLAWRCGSVPEVIEDGVTGFIVDDLEGAVRAAQHIDEISRDGCRSVFEERFSASRMARDYVRLYEKLLAGRASKRAIARNIGTDRTGEVGLRDRRNKQRRADQTPREPAIDFGDQPAAKTGSTGGFLP